MKKSLLFFAFVVCLSFCLRSMGADSIDDLIAGMEKGAAPPANEKDILKAANDATFKAYNDSIADLYLYEVKLSVVDDDNNGGWPYRSFLVESDLTLRRHLTTALKERFEKNPDAMLAYALVCPALYNEDSALLDRLQRYLKDNDPFLYKLEQSHVDSRWRPYIAALRRKVVAPQLLAKMLPYIASHGGDDEVAAAIANPLGLSASGQTWPCRAVNYTTDAQHMHAFGISRGSDPDILLIQRLPEGFRLVRADREGQAIAAMIVSLPSHQQKMMTSTEAQAEFESNWSFWSDEIDDLITADANK